DVAAREALRGDLDEIVLMALRKDPAERYASVEQLDEDVGSWLSGFPMRAARGTRRYRAVKFVHRHRLAVVAAAGGFLLGPVFAVAMAALAARVARERDTALMQTARAEAVSGFLGSLFSSSDPYTSRGNTVTARQLLDAGSKRIQKDLAKQPAVQV